MEYCSKRSMVVGKLLRIGRERKIPTPVDTNRKFLVFLEIEKLNSEKTRCFGYCSESGLVYLQSVSGKFLRIRGIKVLRGLNFDSTDSIEILDDPI
jgi:hypothetical protein